MFGGPFGGGGGGRARPTRGADVTAAVTISFLDALRGTTVPVRLTSTGACDTCRGTGAAPGTGPKTCPTCAGQGVVSKNQGAFSFA